MNIRYAVFLLLMSFCFLVEAKPVQTSSLEDAEITTREGVDKEKLKKKLRRIVSKDQKLSVLILPFKNEFSKKIGTSSKNSLRNILAGLDIDVIDRDVSSELKEELKLLEMSGSANGATFADIADMVFKGEVRNSSFDKQFTAARLLDNGSVTSPKCTVNIHLAIGLELIDLSSGEKRDLVFDNNYSRGYSDVRSCSGIDASQDFRGAAKETFDDKKHLIANLFLDDGYIIGHRVKKNKHYFKTTLKKSGTYKPGTKAAIVVDVVRESALGEQIVENIKGPYGKVANVTGDDYVWLIFKGKDSDSVYLGDKVELHQECGMKCKIINTTKDKIRKKSIF